ncbi:UdgX family uracil-DNA binding protein [Novosphingobium sp. TCA1]|uniref:Type-4 uracil-DNA glycosylase n=1 Tax=Novosphingobium pentaromativorans TaxID=205844 RepID=A0A2W5Q1L9_9SPHN|nr:UdgX family uracil-DNA binding protein [Novosphingobium sp. TCA1]PZQ51157.1 MAG: uracil-DNA glycosylase [Novosphingobium pentaromativorans]GFE77011.1 uracil-DNA glycosylase [Novosphingobium sp. TCA1]
MRVVRLDREDDFDGWRSAARSLAGEGVAPEDIVWQIGDRAADLFADESLGAPPIASARPGASAAPLRVSRQLLELARYAALHSEPERFSLLYILLLRLLDQPQALQDAADPLMRRIEGLARNVRRDSHKMHAFVRFRELADDGGKRFVAWFEPDHHILRANAGFFVDRFTNMRWSILTPRGALHWDGAMLAEGPPASRTDAPGGDPVEAVWKAYYSAIFNPARVMPQAMLKEMPRKYWKNMPETALVPSLIAGARKRERAMIDQARGEPHGKTQRSGPDALVLLAEEAQECRRCPLWKPATQTVFGEGPHDAEIMIVGEQPGDNEDLAGRVFVGPAGAVFDRAMAAAGIDRARTYITNAVKHFKFEPRGKRRIHARPGSGEIEACRWWVEQERAIVRPRLVIAMGATAARSLTGRTVTVGRERGGAVVLPDGTPCWITIHPSYLLRLPPEADADAEFARYAADLRRAAKSLATIV